MTPFISTPESRARAAARKAGRPSITRQFYCVTFEHETNAPLTISGQIEAGSPQKAVYNAVKEARSRAKGFRWSSLVVVIDKNHAIGPKNVT